MFLPSEDTLQCESNWGSAEYRRNTCPAQIDTLQSCILKAQYIIKINSTQMSSWAISGSKQQSEAQITFHLVAAELLEGSLDYFENGSLLPRQCSADWLKWWQDESPVQTHPILWMLDCWKTNIFHAGSGDNWSSCNHRGFLRWRNRDKGYQKKCLLIVSNCFNASPVAAYYS